MLVFLIPATRKKDLPKHVILNLFNRMVVPVLLHGCEVWGYETLDVLKVCGYENMDVHVIYFFN